MAVPERKTLGRLAKLGASNIERIDHTRRLQTDMLRLLERAGLDHGHYVGFRDCRRNHCGLIKCAEACWFGSRRRWLDDALASYGLLQRHRGPLYEVRIVREQWQRPIGQLKTCSISAAKKFNRRQLDSLNRPDVVAVGSFKTAVDANAGRWVGEIHQIVGGIDKVNLRRIFSPWRKPPGVTRNYLSIEEVEDLNSYSRQSAEDRSAHLHATFRNGAWR